MTLSKDNEAPSFAREANPNLDRSELRVNMHKFTLNMIDAEVHFRLRYSDADCSRSRVINEVLANWAQRQWEAAQIQCDKAGDNPFAAIAAKALEFVEPQSEDKFECVRASVPKTTLQVISAAAEHRKAFQGVNADRGTVVNEVMNEWANQKWHGATLTLKLCEGNPLDSDSAGGTHA
ncbi:MULTISPECIES: hypothetical protein [Comamonas]|jgi:hypothetical protein|uniref:Uncharacterized protein n=1 Tax=Comamonas squillarum TaxID=2977320 RepID=A0ABY6A0R4_9BURK|nr:hypothetical protein [Comamonas sp. PR12]MDR2328991.1 hypothetical protein [Comamonas sp.]UXC19134.1 hypothetical protein N4T19_03135 [Comamonas sp. PR12]